MARLAGLEEIYGIAHQAMSIFSSHNMECCLFGSAACALYGTSRCPNDVDLVVFTDEDPEYLKQILTSEEDNFFVVASSSPNADYKVLWYSLTTFPEEPERLCKVDILTPGERLDIPDVPSDQIEYINRLPVMPLVPLLMLKLQGWSHHRDSDRPDMRDKQHVDVEDIEELLAISCDHDTTISSLGWLSNELIDAAQERVYDYVEEFRESALYWQSLGFQTY